MYACSDIPIYVLSIYCWHWRVTCTKKKFPQKNSFFIIEMNSVWIQKIKMIACYLVNFFNFLSFQIKKKYCIIILHQYWSIQVCSSNVYVHILRYFVLFYSGWMEENVVFSENLKFRITDREMKNFHKKGVKKKNHSLTYIHIILINCLTQLNFFIYIYYTRYF